jgi:hypothetical protein
VVASGNKGKNAMNQKTTESKGAPDVRPLQDNELDAIAGGVPGLATMISSATGTQIGNTIDSLSQAAGGPR